MQNIITVMCDYSADGLWYNGSAIDCDYLIDKGFPQELIAPLRSRFESWQWDYEGFRMWDAKMPLDFIFNSKAYKEFERDGEQLFKEIYELGQIYAPDHLVEYFDDRESKRYIMGPEGYPIEKGK